MKRPIWTASLLSLLAMYSYARAESSSAAVPSVQKADLSKVMQDEEDDDYIAEPGYVRGDVGFETDGYRYAPPNASEQLYPILMAHSQGRTEWGYLEFYESTEAMVMSPLSQHSTPEPYLEAPELFVATSPRLEGVKLLVGRRLEDWNHLDEEWKLGIWQPRYRWDYLRPDEVGLTGVTLEVEQPLFKAVLFGSYLYIPERGVPIGTQNGQFISTSPWFISPPNHIQILTQSTPLSYDLQIPAYNQIVFQKSVSAMARVGDDKQGPWVSAAYAYKPMNQLLLAFDGHLIVPNSGPSVTDVPIVPRVVYHHLYSLEGGFNTPTVSGWVSVLKDVPAQEVTAPLGGTWTLEEVSPSIAVSPTLEVRITDPDENKIKLSMSYLHQQGGNAPSASSDSAIPGSTSVFEERYPFQEAMLLSGAVEMPGLADSLFGLDGDTILSTSVLYDIQNRGAILSLDAKYKPNPRWTVGIGLDLLGSQDAAQAANEPPDDFIGRYQGEDRMRVGVSYVF